MTPILKRADLKEYFFNDEGCHITELANHAEDGEVSVARARVEPGITTSWHSLEQTTERYIIVAGEGLAEIGDQAPLRVCAGDTLIIPPSYPQRISNTGEGDLVFLAVCTPRFKPENYRTLER